MIVALYRLWVRRLAGLYPADFRRSWAADFEADAMALLDRCRIRHGSVVGPLRAAGVMWMDTVRGVRAVRADMRSADATGSRTRGDSSEGWEGMMTGWIDDVRVALRALMRRPGLALIVIGTLGIGLGANMAIFGVLDRIILAPMRFEGGERVVFLTIRDAEKGWQFSPSQQHLELWRERSRTLESVQVYRPATYRIARGSEEPVRREGASVSIGMLAMTSESPILGRGFSPADAEPGAPPVVMLDESWWRSEWGADPDVIGATVRIQDEIAVVIGVWPERVRPSLQQSPEVWTPLTTGAELDRQVWAHVVAMHVPGSDGGAVAAELRGLGTPDDSDAPEGAPTVEPATAFLSASFVESIWILFWGTLALGLVAAVNSANLLLARADGRAGELGVRAALGGSRVRLLRLFATEAVLLSVGGLVFAGLLAVLGTGVLLELMPSDVGVLDENVLLTGRVGAWGALITTTLVGVCTLVPATRLRSAELRELIRGQETRGMVGSSSRLRSGLVVAQVALAVVLVTGAGLTLRSWRALATTDPGWRIAETVMVGVTLPAERYPEADVRAAFWDAFTARLAGLPDVQGVTSIGNPFFRASLARQIPLPLDWEGPPLDEDEFATTEFGLANHFEVMGVPIRGDVRAGEGSERTIVVSEGYAKRFGVALGEQIGVPGDTLRWTVVGIAGDVRAWALRMPDDIPHLFYPEARLEGGFHRIVVRTSRPDLTAGMIRATLSEIDPQLRTAELATGPTAMKAQATRERFAALLLAILGVTGLLIASAGVYGVVALGVQRRTREVGLRMALGAEGGRVVRTLVARGMRPVVLGAVVGLTLSGVLAGRIEQVLFEVSSRDPASLAGGMLVLVVVGLTAAWLPARRATRIDPLEALRAE